MHQALDDRSAGSPLEAGVCEGLADDLGSDFSEVRVHADSAAARLAADLNAEAFTRGSDIYFGNGRFEPGTEAGRRLLRHELAHVLQQARGEVSTYAGQVVPPEHTSEAHAASGAARGGPKPHPGRPGASIQRQASEARATGGRWNLDYTMWGKLERFTDLDDAQLVGKLDFFYSSLRDDAKQGEQAQRDWQQDVGSTWGGRWAAGTASLAGGSDFPPVEQWVKVTQEMADAFQMIRESRWAVMAAQGRELDEGARRAAIPVTAERVQQIVAALERGDRELQACWHRWRTFLHETETGASRAVTGLKVARAGGAIAAAGLTGGAAGLGVFGTAVVGAAGGGVYAAGQELAGQVGEIAFSDRTSINWAAVGKAGVTGAAAGFVGGLLGGAFSRAIGNALGRLVGKLSPEVMQEFGIAGSDLLTNGEEYFVAWLGNTASSPFVTATTVLMQTALNGRLPPGVRTWGDFFDLVFEQTVESGVINAFFAFAHAYRSGRTTPAEGGRPGAGESGGGTVGVGPGAASVHDEAFAVNRVYEAEVSVPKHTKTSRTVGGRTVGAEPRNGQRALDNSIPLNNRRRIGVDVANDQIVVLDRTGNLVRDKRVVGGIYHGHVRSWGQLSKDMRAVLTTYGIKVSNKGKITLPEGWLDE